MPPPSYPFQAMVAPHPRSYASVQQVDDSSLWPQGAPGSSRPLTAPPLRPPSVDSPPHQQDDPTMFGSTNPNLLAAVRPQGASQESREFGSADPNLADTAGDDVEMEVEGTQGPGDTSIPNLIEEPMHDLHAEVGLGQRPDIQPLNEHVAAEVMQEDNSGRGVIAEEVAPSMSPR